MTEIELKAHIADHAETEKVIRTFAEFQKETVKNDTYWKGTKPAVVSQDPADPTAAPEIHTAAAGAIFTFLAALVAAIAVIAGASKTVAILICLGASMCVATAIVMMWKKRHTESNREVQNTSQAIPFRERSTRQEGNTQPIKIRVRNEDDESIVTYKRKELQGDIEVNDEREFTISDRAPFETILTDLGFTLDIKKEKKTRSFICTENDFHITLELSEVTGLGWFLEIEILADSPNAATTARAQHTLRTVLARCNIPETAIEPRYYTEMLRTHNQL